MSVDLVQFDFDDVVRTVERFDSRADRDDAEEAVQAGVERMLRRGEPLIAAHVVQKARSTLSNAVRRRERSNCSLDAFAEADGDAVPIELAIDEVDFDALVRLRNMWQNPILRLRLAAGGGNLRRGVAVSEVHVLSDDLVGEARRLRKENEMTYGEIGRRIGAREETVRRWCRGERRATPSIPGWSRGLILEALRAVNAEDGRPPNLRMMRAGDPDRDPRLPDRSTFYEYFRGIEEAFVAAGLPYQRQRRTWALDETVTSIRSLVAELGRSPNWKEWKAAQRRGEHQRIPSNSNLIRLFGSETIAGVLKAVAQEP